MHDSLCPGVPMFHANAWATPYAAAMSGAKLVFPGAALDGKSLFELFEAERVTCSFGVEVIQGWGMTEMSPVGTLSTLKPKIAELPVGERYRYKAKQGRPIYTVELKIVDAEGREQPHDGVAMGEMLVRGPWVISGYYNDEPASAAAFDEAGWLRTGDVATVDEDGYVQIVDRRKD